MIGYVRATIIASNTFQKLFGISSAEVKYVALSEACQILVWLRNVIRELGVRQYSRPIAQGNIGPSNWTEGEPGKYSSRKKYMDFQYHYTMHEVQKRSVRLIKVSTARMATDFRTKKLGPIMFSTAIRNANVFFQ